MDITHAYLIEQHTQFQKQREQLIANLNANQGIIQHIEQLIERLSAIEDVKLKVD